MEAKQMKMFVQKHLGIRTFGEGVFKEVYF